MMAGLPAVPAVSRIGPPIWLLVLITLSGTLGMHMFVPALSDAARDLGTGVSTMQITISLYIAGLAVGQLIYGPLSDAFGRRRLLLGGLVLYTAGGLAAAFSDGVYGLIAARLLQALGGCAGLVLGRAIVRDTSGTRDAVSRLALLNLMIVIGPGLAPIVGGYMVEHVGWRSIFLVLAGLGAVAFACCAWLLEETGQPTGEISASIFVSDYRALLRSPIFLGFALGGGCATTALYGFLAAAPFVFINELHRPATELGFYLAILMFGMSAGNALSARLVRQVQVEKVLLIGNTISLLGAAGLLLIALTGHMSVAAVVGLMLAFTIGAGASSPVALTKAISANPHLTGSAAGLYGFSQMAVGAAATALVSLGRDPALAAGVVLTLMSVVARVSFSMAIRKERLRNTAAA
jgi:MFS transporter, DHA1 family, multidrug resistance protein